VFEHRFGPLLVDRLRAGWIELLVDRVLLVAEQEDHFACLAGSELQPHVVGADRRPAVGDRVERFTARDRERRIQLR